MTEQTANKFCIRGQLVGVREGEYTVLVFKDLDAVIVPGYIPYSYVMCTVLPNWQHAELQKGQIGYLSYTVVRAGETWYDPESGEHVQYRYSANYFADFVPETHVIDGDRIVSKTDPIIVS